MMSDKNDTEDREDPSAQTLSAENTGTAEKAYKVGYGRPPLNRQFKPGCSGNPKGRAKGSRNLKTVVQQAASRPIRVRKNGKVQTTTTLEAMVENAALKAAQGDTKALITFVGLLARSGALNEADHTSATSWPEADDAIIKDYMRRHGHGTNDAEND
jgi:hypothetical protein